jgi:glycosyltransferase involved in cell wall biosynthesis
MLWGLRPLAGELNVKISEPLSQRPQISVVMPVHNALPYLDEAVQSILDQTCSDFEFVIYDDASTDGSSNRLQEWKRRDPRIRLFKGRANLGPAASSNEVVRHSSAPFIARMDADDISMPDRLERQLEMISTSSDIGIVASLSHDIDCEGRKLRPPSLWRLTRKSYLNPFAHGSMMFRRDLFDAIGGYRVDCEFWEDVDFVLRASEQSRILILPRPLYCYRHSASSTRLVSKQVRVENAFDLMYRSLARVRQGRDYDDLLRNRTTQGDGRVDPRVFVALSFIALWSGHLPEQRKRFLARAKMRFDVPTLAAGVWIGWAAVSPGTLRRFLNILLWSRNALFWNRSPLDEPVEWLTPRSRLTAAASGATQQVQAQ